MRPDFVPKHFYLLGEDVSTAREIDIPSTVDEDELRQLVASHFAIVSAKGMHLDTAIPRLAA
jgi:hypothetical protein